MEPCDASNRAGHCGGVLTLNVERGRQTGEAEAGGHVHGDAGEVSAVPPPVHAGDVKIASPLEPARGVHHRLAVQLPVEPDEARVGDHALEVDAAALSHHQVLRVAGEVEVIERGHSRPQ